MRAIGLVTIESSIPYLTVETRAGTDLLVCSVKLPMVRIHSSESREANSSPEDIGEYFLLDMRNSWVTSIRRTKNSVHTGGVLRASDVPLLFYVVRDTYRGRVTMYGDVFLIASSCCSYLL